MILIEAEKQNRLLTEENEKLEKKNAAGLTPKQKRNLLNLELLEADNIQMRKIIDLKENVIQSLKKKAKKKLNYAYFEMIRTLKNQFELLDVFNNLG